MKDTRLLEVFNEAKSILCKYDYYIQTPKKTLHLTNSEQKLPHLMGLQYVGTKDLYTGDYGAYAIKKGRITVSSIEKLVRKYYNTPEKQERILKMIHLKMDYLPLLGEMLSSYSHLYLFDVNANPHSGFDSDYLLIHEADGKMLHLGIVKAKNDEKNICHCNSFMTTYKKERDYDILYRELRQRYEIMKIIREDKSSKKTEVIYQSHLAKLREISGIEKMLLTAGVKYTDKLLKSIIKLNMKFGKYHTLEMLNNPQFLFDECADKRENALVKDFLALWNSHKK